MKEICPLCKNDNLNILYTMKDMPIFQNKVYATQKNAKSVITADLKLCHCQNCGFVFNKDFDSSIMTYDEEYQNEQNYSSFFKNYLNDIVSFLDTNFSKEDKIIEIGSGKGYFLNLLEEKGFKKVTGFDPAYEGEKENIVKDYYGSQYSSLNADLIILRHTLEHISEPFDFLREIAKANNYRGKVFIEVPCFEWIEEKNAFWDVFYEHCNYFTRESLGNMFSASKTGTLFNDQYIYVFADLKNLRGEVLQCSIKSKKHLFENINQSVEILKDNRIAVWGAGAKGVTFLNLVDAEKKQIEYVVDINPKKQQKYIAKTSHEIISVQELKKLINKEVVDTIFIMNENYKKEIVLELNELKIKYIILGDTMSEIQKFKNECASRVLENSKNGELLKSSKRFSEETLKSGYSYNFTWLGRPIIQYPQDMIALQEIIWEVKPDLIIETGIAHGGSLIFSASMLTLLEACGEIENGKVLGIDIDIREHNKKAIEEHPMSKKITMFQGSSIDDEMIARVREFAKQGKKVMVILDSNHTHAHVLAELRAYAHLASVGSYCCVFDTIVEDMPENSFPNRPWGKGDNPKTAVWEYLKENDNFVIDKDIENKILITVAPDGYLKRIK